MSATESSSLLIARESLGLAPYVAPEGDFETKIAAIFAEVFSLDRVGATDDFFDLGGDSLLAEALSLRLSEQTAHDFPISSLALQGSPRKIAALLQPASGAPASVSHRRRRPPIFILHGRVGYALLSAEFMGGLAEGQEIHIFEAPGIRGGTSYDRIEDIASAYIAQLEKIHPEGPILIASFCVGALVALEMAVQLAAKGRPVHQLVLLDPGNPYKLNRVKWAEFNGKPIDPRSLKKRWEQHLPPLRILDRWRLGTYANDVRRFRRKFEVKNRRGVSNFTLLSIPAQAKLHASYEHYQPKVFLGPVAIVSSAAREDLFRNASHGWGQLLPQAEIHGALDIHSEVNTEASARAMQSIFDAALARAPSGLRQPEQQPQEATPAIS